jgi:hypothetical protein
MLSFKQYIVEKEIAVYAFDLENLWEMKLTDIPVNVETKSQPNRDNTPSSGIPTPKQKGGNVWQKLRKGASSYFDAPLEEQHRLRKEAETHFGRKLLGTEASNPKLAKSGDVVPEYNTKALSLAPSTMSGIDVCPAATKECKAACLGKSAGRASMAPVKSARVKKTHEMFDKPHLFYAKIDKELDDAKRTDKRNGKKTAVRLNVLSDIAHEHVAPQLFKKHSDVQFYDYTKIAGRTRHARKPDNYHLTLSSTGLNHSDSNWKDVRKHLDNGGVASMVFNVPSRGNNPLPTHVHDEETGKRYRVVDGDEHDHRHLDHTISGVAKGEGVIAGLRVKGGAPNAARAGNFATRVENGIAVARKGQN